MRIISKFHDYYDSAQGYGQDPNLIYRRVIEQRDPEHWLWDRRIPDILDICPYYYLFKPQLAVIGFCGRCFPVWLDEAFVLSTQSLSEHTKTKYWLTSEEVIEQHLSIRESRYYGFGKKDVRRAVQQVDAHRGVMVASDVFRYLSCPAFLVCNPWRRSVRHLRVFTNPRLATLGFMRTMDAYSAFQEIAMFLSSMLARDDEAPRTVGNDRIIAASKGFDDRSFRTESPGQKKLNRKLNRQRKRQNPPGDV